MVKKILIGVLVVVLLGAVAVGFYDTTRGASSFGLPQWNGIQASLTGEQSPRQGNGGGRGQGGGQGQGTGQGQGQGQGMGQGQGQGQGMGQGQGQGQGMGQGRGQGQGGGQGRGQGQAQGTPIQHTWVTLNGTAVSFDGQQTLTVDTTERGQLPLWLGPVGYADQQGVTFAAGDAVTILGFDGDNGVFQAGEITNTTSGQTLYLRDPNGRPLWAGQGQGNSQGGN